MRRRLLLGLVALPALAGCGKKGSLRLPRADEKKDQTKDQSNDQTNDEGKAE